MEKILLSLGVITALILLIWAIIDLDGMLGRFADVVAWVRRTNMRKKL